MCFGGGQPEAPVNKPSHALGEAHKNAFDLSMTPEGEEEQDLDGRTRDQNRRASGHKKD